MAHDSLLPGQSGPTTRGIINTNFDTLFTFKESTYISTLNLLAYGAVGDGVTDNLTALTNAINAAATQQATLIIPQGTYFISNNINLDLSGKKLSIQGYGNAVIKSVGKMITLKGVSSADDTLTASINKGADSITATNLHNTVVAGDILQIKSTRQYANVGISNIFKGEIVEVQRVNAGTIYLSSSTYDSYNMADTVICKLNAMSMSMIGVNFLDTTLTLYNHNHSFFTSFDITNGNTPAIQLYDSKNVLFDGLNLVRNGVVKGSAPYGICPASSHNVTIRSCYVSNFWQGIIAGGKYCTRDYFVLYNRVHGDIASSGFQIDTHTQLENAKIVGNTGINCSIYGKGSNIEVINNHIDGRIEMYREDLTNETTLHTLHYTDYSSVLDNICSSIWIGFNTYRDIIPVINVCRNIVKATNNYALLVYRDNDTDCVIKEFNIKDNYFYSDSNDAIHYGVYFSVGLTINKLVLSGNSIKCTDFRPYYQGTPVDLMIMNNNTFECTGNYASHFVWILNATKLHVNNNTFDKAPLFISNCHATVKCNNFINMQSSDSAIYQNLTTDEGTGLVVSDNEYESIIKPVSISHPSVTTVNEVRYLSGALTDGTPTNAEINAICGSTAALLGKGFKLIIKDTTGSGLTYECISNGTSWGYKILTTAV